MGVALKPNRTTHVGSGQGVVRSTHLRVVLAPEVAATAVALQVEQHHRAHRRADLQFLPAAAAAQHLQLERAAEGLRAAEPPRRAREPPVPAPT